MVTRTPTPSLTPPPRDAARPAWTWPHYLAIAGLPILFWNAWTVIAWLADGPEQSTVGRDTDSFGWYAAKTIEGLTVCAALAVIVVLYRGCRRQREFLTTDVMFCLVAGTIFWQNFVSNFYAPIFHASTNFYNVNNTCGHQPFVVNPECGQATDPLLFTWTLETFGILGMAMVFAKGVAWARRRWVGISTVKLIGFVLLMGIFADCVIEPLILCGLRLWNYQGPQGSYIPTGGNFQWSILEFWAGGAWIGMLAAFWIFRNDRGETLAERGLGHYSRRVRKSIALLATYGFIQWTTFLVGCVPYMVISFYEEPWKKLPDHMINGICDAPGWTGTAYGPCPGTPGAPLPVRGA